MITLKLCLHFLGLYRFFLLFFASIGFSIGALYSVITPKIYEAYIDVALPQVNRISSGKFDPTSQLAVPSVEEIRKFYLNPTNISESLLRSCSLDGITNQNRKDLTGRIFSQSADPQNFRIAVRVQIPGKQAALRCATAIESQIISYSNAQKNAYLSSNPHNIGILNLDAAPRGVIVVSDSYIMPRPFLLTLGTTTLGFLFGLFLIWFSSQWKKNTQ